MVSVDPQTEIVLMSGFDRQLQDMVLISRPAPHSEVSTPSGLTPFSLVESQPSLKWIRELFDKFRQNGRDVVRAPVKLSVTPQYARLEDDGTVKSAPFLNEVPRSGKEIICIEIKNLSSMAVKVSQVGFTRKGSRIRFMIPEPNTTDRKPFERSLQCGQAVTAYFDIRRTTPLVDKAYVVTDHGEVCSGRSPVLDEIRWRTYDPFD
jgi:hypothetical protein